MRELGEETTVRVGGGCCRGDHHQQRQQQYESASGVGKEDAATHYTHYAIHFIPDSRFQARNHHKEL